MIVCQTFLNESSSVYCSFIRCMETEGNEQCFGMSKAPSTVEHKGVPTKRQYQTRGW